MGFGPTHTFLRGLAGFAFESFWYKCEVHSFDGQDPEEVVPAEGTPMIVVANHWNSAADVRICLFSSFLALFSSLISPVPHLKFGFLSQVAVLSIYFPHYRKLHYWAKSTLFAPGLPKKILLDAGNLPVDRKTKVGLAFSLLQPVGRQADQDTWYRTIKSCSLQHLTLSSMEKL